MKKMLFASVMVCLLEFACTCRGESGVESKVIHAGNIPVSIRPGLLGDSGVAAGDLATVNDLATKLSISNITPTVTSGIDTVPSNFAVQQAISNATPSVSLQNVLNTGKTATNANMVIGSTNQTLGKVAIVGEAGAYTNTPLLYLERTATATGNLISGVVTGRVVGGIGLSGQLLTTGSNGGTNYLATLSWDATNKVYVITETAQ
jgi:hypothetical protein